MYRLKTKMVQETGSTLLEFTFTSMILLSLTFAMIDFGRYIYASNVVRAAAQAGARAGIVEEDVNSAIQSNLIALDIESATWNTTPNPVSSAATGEIVEIEVTYEFEFITPFLSGGGPVQIVGSTSMLKLFPGVPSS